MGAKSGAMPVGPGRLDDDPTQVRAAGFADSPASGSLPARVLARDDAAVAHQLPGVLKARHLPKLSHDRHGADLGDPAQALQRLDHCAHLLRQRLDRRIDRALQAHDTLGLMLDFVQVIHQRRLLRGLLEVLLLHPGQMLRTSMP